MSDLKTVFFKNAAGEIHSVVMPGLDASQAIWRHPWEWAYAPDKFKPAPEGFVFSEGNGHGIGRVQGACVRAD